MTIRERPEGEHLLRTPLGPGDRTRGPRDAPVTLVEYGDYQCPDCIRSYSVVEAVLEAVEGRVLYAFRHFPLISLHPRALPAALAAEAAGLQGRFWEMHARLFQTPQDLSDAALRRYAEELGLDPARFDGDRADPAVDRRIREGRLAGARSGVNGTPTFFINGLRWGGPHSRAGLLDALEADA